MKLNIFLISLLMAGTSFAQTITPESRAAAEKLLAVLKMDENFDNSIKQAVQMQSGMLDKMGLSEEEKAAATKNMKESMSGMLEKFSWANTKGMFVDIYAEVFTGQELQGIIEFYESPAGQKFVEKQPQLMQVTMQKMQALMAEMMPEIQKEMTARIQSTRQTAHASTKARNIASVEKAKAILTLPVGTVNGAMGADETTNISSGEGRANLLAALKISDISELTVDGAAINIGNMTTKASY